MRFRNRLLASAAAAVAVSATALSAALPASAITGPFTWGSPTSASWCPSWHGQNGCNNVQTQSPFTNSFDPAQVSVSGTVASLTMNSAQTASGAMNTENSTGALETYSFPKTITSLVNLPCSGSPAQVDNWPAIWMARTTNTGQLPGSGEIDIAEGSKGHLDWAYHYTNTSGVLVSAFGVLAVAGDTTFPCGSTGTGGDYYYKVHLYTNASGKPQIDFYARSVLQGGVSQSCSSPCQSIGVPVDTNPRYLLYDNATGSESGPKVGNVSMKLKGFTVTGS